MHLDLMTEVTPANRSPCCFPPTGTYTAPEEGVQSTVFDSVLDGAADAAADATEVVRRFLQTAAAGVYPGPPSPPSPTPASPSPPSPLPPVPPSPPPNVSSHSRAPLRPCFNTLLSSYRVLPKVIV